VRRSERLASIPDSMYTNLYIKNLDGDITEDVLRLKFSEFGNITSMAVAKDGDGNPKGFAFVNFQNHESAKLALEKMHGTQLGRIFYLCYLTPTLAFDKGIESSPSY